MIPVRSARIYARRWTLVWAFGFAVSVVWSLWLSEGHLIYTLDDPYIHLAVAENIARGGYGVNLTEFSSPSSSILYPFLLAATELAGLGDVGPLAINALAAGLSIWLLLEFFWRHAVPQGVPSSGFFPNLLAPFLIVSINAFALPMTGMEHSIHVLAVVATTCGLVAVAEGEATPAWLVPAMICVPLLRFEGMALAGIGTLVLLLLGRWRPACAVAAVVLAGYGTYGFVMYRLGLPLLPSSVMVKSDVFANVVGDTDATKSMLALVRNVGSSLMKRWGVIFALAICAVIVSLRVRKGHARPWTSPEVVVGGIIALTLGAHLIAGRYGWFHRYEVYAVATLMVGGSYLLRVPLRHVIETPTLMPRIGVICALGVLFAPYFYATFSTPRASRGIYEQQYQMHRFATDFFPYPVAVNDLGWVSYRNDNYVLDLWGLGSERARRLRSTGKLDAEAISTLIEEASVEYVMMYEKWLGRVVPDDWCLMAVLRSEKVTAGVGAVSFYATSRDAAARMHAALDRFAPTLPKRVTLDRAACGDRQHRPRLE